MEKQHLKTGGILRANNDFIICTFSSPRLVLSTSLYNGGYLLADAIFNHRLNIFVDSEADLPGGSMENYLALAANEQGLDNASSTGLLTSARMHCRGYSTVKFKDITVEIIATAGTDKNAVRAGDQASYYEDNGNYCEIGGTINILAFTNIDIPTGAMAKALITITEAKTATLQELAIISPLTQNPATGTGTDGIILACNPKSSITCKDTGTQSKLGELFCVAVKTAVKQSLALECDITPSKQGSIVERIRRLGLYNNYQPSQLAESAQAKVLLAASQTIWQQYRWGLININDIYQFINILEYAHHQPVGTALANTLTEKISNC